jgi:voltage-gated potassium channel
MTTDGAGAANRAHMCAARKAEPGDGMVPGDRRVFRRSVGLTLARVTGFGLALLVLYAVAPFGERLQGHVLAGLAGCLGALIVLVIFELRSIARSSHPEVKAVEAVGMTLPLTLLPFAAAYYGMSRATETAFEMRLTRLDALYFTMTTFSTVGYGDITAKSEPARAVVIGQITVDLIIIGLIAKVILGAAQRRRDTLRDDGR